MIRQKYSVPFSLLFLLATAFSVRAQNAWPDIALAGPQAKILSTPHIPRISVGLQTRFPLSRPAAQNIDFQSLQSVFQSPEVATPLFEQFGGPFFIGQVSGQPAQSLAVMTGRFQVQPGIFTGLRLSPHFSLRVAAERYRAEWSGGFPVIVLPFSQQHAEPTPQTRQGALSASASGWLGEAAVQFNFPGRVVQPFVEGGLRGVFPGRSEASATLAGVKAPVDYQPFQRSFSAFGGAGMRVFFWKNGYAQTVFSLGKTAGGIFAGEMTGGIGWRF